ncbi:MAG: XRE family transcriptional regulator [Desulfobacterales bacterium]|jgi:transcriptional regulator with XRE-family HTH domain|nr:XRE family transcriptional regulator [Desulfobacterales bacterium]
MTAKGKSPFLEVDFFEDLTAAIAAPAGREVEAIGARIRALRQEKGVSLEELSRLTGFEVGFLSAIEADEVQPQLGTMIKLSKALDSAFGRLVSGTGDKLFSITRRGERVSAARSTARAGKKHLYSYKSLTPGVKGHHMEALVVQLLVSQDKEMSVHEGEEFVFVLNGTVLLEIGGERHELEPGDSAYYLSTTPHLISAKEDKATILAVIYEG